MQPRMTSLQDMKQVVKTWRNRSPWIADDLSHWSDIFQWRQQHYQFVAQHFVELNEQSGGSQTMLGVHASAQVGCNRKKYTMRDLNNFEFRYNNHRMNINAAIHCTTKVCLFAFFIFLTLLTIIYICVVPNPCSYFQLALHTYLYMMSGSMRCCAL